MEDPFNLLQVLENIEPFVDYIDEHDGEPNPILLFASSYPYYPYSPYPYPPYQPPPPEYKYAVRHCAYTATTCAACIDADGEVISAELAMSGRADHEFGQCHFSYYTSYPK